VRIREEKHDLDSLDVDLVAKSEGDFSLCAPGGEGKGRKGYTWHSCALMRRQLNERGRSL